MWFNQFFQEGRRTNEENTQLRRGKEEDKEAPRQRYFYVVFFIE